MANFVELNEKELMASDGGFVITGSMIVAGVGCIAAGVAVGYAVGTVLEWIF